MDLGKKTFELKNKDDDAQTIDDLLDFIDTNYEKLTDKNYVDLCRSTMRLYEYKRPGTKEKALTTKLMPSINVALLIHELTP